MKGHFDDFDLNEYLDGQGSPAWREGLALHLSGCGDCQGRLDRLETTLAKIVSLPEVELDRDLSPAVVDALRSRKRSRASGRWLLAGQATLALVLLYFSRSMIVGLLPAGLEALSVDFGLLADSANIAILTAAASAASFAENTASILAETIDQIPSFQAGINLWVLAAAAGILWLAVHAGLLRSDRGGKPDPDPGRRS
jgi:anti-sigma factor RsiW